MPACGWPHLRCCIDEHGQAIWWNYSKISNTNSLTQYGHATVHRHRNEVVETVKVLVNHWHRNPWTHVLNCKTQDLLVLHQGVTADEFAIHGNLDGCCAADARRVECNHGRGLDVDNTLCSQGTASIFLPFNLMDSSCSHALAKSVVIATTAIFHAEPDFYNACTSNHMCNW